MNDTTDQFWDYFNVAAASTAASVPAPEQGFVLALYGALLGAGALGNGAVFASLVRSRRRKSRVDLLMTHLAVADLIVTFVVIPLEIGWRTTNAWMAGNYACKIFLVLRAFGLYLSSNVLVCISLDRFFAVVYPLRLAVARSRSKTMLSFAWIIALICSLPQSLVFRVLQHPKVPEFEQCVSFEAFPSHHQELAYNVFCLCAMYFLPLLIITVCYGCIFYEISKTSKEISDKSVSDHSRIQLRRSDRRPLARARRRTLRMTVTIVAVFACCWLPYATMTLWYMIDRESAMHVSSRLQDLFFIMAVSNSCMDPLVYGTYALDLKSIVTKTLRKIFCIHANSKEITTLLMEVGAKSGGHGSAPAKSSAKQTLPYHPLLEPFRRIFRPLFENLWIRPERRNLRHPVQPACRYKVRFQETSLAGPSATSDPVPCWRDYSEEHKIKPARSCEVFTLQSPRDYY